MRGYTSVKQMVMFLTATALQVWVHDERLIKQAKFA
jgi:hypothetical protein